MKKTLVLMRHGEAQETHPEGDYQRGLTPAGEEKTRAQGQLMMEKDIWPDGVLCSAAIRTRQTLDLLRRQWEGDCEPVMEDRPEIYRASPADLIKMLKAQDAGRGAL
ncbi:MAG TPA: histidine phosphatase family protein, partial [Alphaproteobacteria bacterium]|nr:histidine phosphatase family protein [Alphaproteobacteria bacterium]